MAEARETHTRVLPRPRLGTGMLSLRVSGPKQATRLNSESRREKTSPTPFMGGTASRGKGRAPSRGSRCRLPARAGVPASRLASPARSTVSGGLRRHEWVERRTCTCEALKPGRRMGEGGGREEGERERKRGHAPASRTHTPTRARMHTHAGAHTQEVNGVA